MMACSDTCSVYTHLLEEVLNDGVLGHLRTGDEASLDLLLDARQHLLILFRREAFRACAETPPRMRTHNSNKTSQKISL